MNVIRFSLLKTLLFSLLLLSLFQQADTKPFVQRKNVQQFIQTMVEQYHFDKNSLSQLFQGIQSDTATLKNIQKPKEKLEWHQYKKLFITEKRVHQGVKFWQKYASVLNQAEEKYGVPASIIVAIIGVETNYGQIKGHHRVLDSLATLSFEYPPREKFFKKELEHFLLLSRELKQIAPQEITGSYAGAMGIAQFMPSSYRHFAIDSENKGYSDLINSFEDAIFSVANYLKQNGWVRKGPIATQVYISHQGLFQKRLNDPSYLNIARSLREWTQYQVKLNNTQDTFDDRELAKLIELKGTQELEYWLTFPNFSVIKTYNTNTIYAMAVWQLSQLVKKQYDFNL